MKSQTDPWSVMARALELLRAGQPFAVVTVLQAEGSTPVKAGAKALIGNVGLLAGTVGGGAVEAEAVRRALVVLRGGASDLFEFALGGCDAAGGQPVCGGTMRLLVQPATPELAEAWAQAFQAERHANGSEDGLLLTAVRHDDGVKTATRWLAATALAVAEHSGGPTAAELGDCLRRELVRLFVAGTAGCGARVEVLVEPVVSKPVLLLAGGGHVGQAVAAQAKLVGFDLAVLDDRREFVQAPLFPDGTRLLCRPVAEGVASFPIDERTYIVIVTRGHQHDAEALAACIRRPAAYIGMIGSRRKVTLLREDFVASGRATAEEFGRVYAPIGLDLGATTVPEIAASIVAQLIAVRRRRTAPRIPGASQ
jgi:xanthine dehydrogenase accessory factor